MTSMLHEHVRQALGTIEPTVLPPNGSLLYPCTALLRDGRVLDCVYFVDQATFTRLSGKNRPDELSKEPVVSPSDVVSVRESRYRLPARFANEIYRAGETGFGYTAFTLLFPLGYRRHYTVPGSAVDFLEYPLWFGPSSVKGVVLYPSKRKLRAVPVAHWCVFYGQVQSI